MASEAVRPFESLYQTQVGRRVPEPKTVKNRMHLDIDAIDIEADATRLEALGAGRSAARGRSALAWPTHGRDDVRVPHPSVKGAPA